MCIIVVVLEFCELGYLARSSSLKISRLADRAELNWADVIEVHSQHPCPQSLAHDQPRLQWGEKNLDIVVYQCGVEKSQSRSKTH